MKESQIFNRKDSQRTLQSLTIDPAATDTSTSLSDMVSGGLYDYMTYTMGSGTKYQQLIRNEVIDGINLAGGFALEPTTGSLWTWGQNDQGQLGDGTTANRSSPVSVLLNRVIVSCQRDIVYNTFALDTTGTVWTWGNALYGSLGNNTGGTNNGLSLAVSSPVSVVGGRQFAVLATGVMPTAQAPSGGALDMNGYAWMWGNNNVGQLGQNTTATVSSPVSVIGGRQFVALNRNGRAIDLNNQAWAWGDNSYGQLGTGTTTTQSSPVSVITLPATITKIASSGPHTLLLTKTGTVYGMGLNASGQLGDGTTFNRSLPVLVGTGNAKIVDIAIGTNHSVALDQYGKIWSWGNNSYGQLGNNTTLTISVTTIPSFSVTSLISGIANAVTSAPAMGLLDSNSNAWVWGNSVFGNLGNGTTNNYSSPISQGYRWKQFNMSGEGTAYGIDANNYAWMWGVNSRGALGNNTTDNSSSPISVLGGHRWSTITIGSNNTSYAFTVGLDTNGYAWEWGAISGGAFVSSPVSVGGPFARLIPRPPTTAFSIALDSNSYAWVWGYGYYGYLGNNTTGGAGGQSYYSSPVSVLGGIQWYDIQAGGYDYTTGKILGLDSNRHLWAWGAGINGGLGDNTTNYRSSPTSVVGGRQYSKIYASMSDTLAALDLNSYAWTWGTGLIGGVAVPGDGTTFRRSSPVSVIGGLQFSDLKFAMDYNNLGGVLVGLTGSGAVWTCGSNSSGALGDGTTNTRSSPVSVLGLSGITSINTTWGPYAQASSSPAIVWSWGDNAASLLLLGDGTTSPRSSPVSIFNPTNYIYQTILPVSVPTTTRFTAISATDNQVAGVDTDGNCWDWGANQGNTPLMIPASIARIPSGPSNNAASMSAYIDTNSYAWVWGNNLNGELGLGSFANQSSPILIQGHQWKQFYTTISAQSAAGLDLNNYAWTWGVNQNGNLGDGTTTDGRSFPVSVVGGRQFTQFSFGTLSVGLDTNSYAWQWGLQASSPVSVQGGLQFSNLILSSDDQGAGFALARDSNSYAWSWGIQGYLQGCLGNNATSYSVSSPVSVVGTHQWRDLKIANNMIIGLDSNSYAWCWGYNGGQLGNNVTNNASSPVSVVGGRQWLATAITYGVIIALDTNNYAWCWGYNNGNGQLGNNATNICSSPVSVFGGLQFAQIGVLMEATGSAMYGVTLTSTLWAWGANGSGTIGDGTTNNRSSPVLIAGYTPKIVGGRHNLLASDGNSTIWSWGSNNVGSVGDGTTNLASSPVIVRTGVTSTAAGTITNVAQFIPGPSVYVSSTPSLLGYLDANGYAWVWGSNSYGQLGMGSTNLQSSPISVQGGHTWKQLYAGDRNCLALDTSNYAWAWGHPTLCPSIGDGTTAYRSSPVSIIGNRQFTQLSFGTWNSALDTNSYAWSWGYIGTYPNGVSSPISIVGGRQFLNLAVTINDDSGGTPFAIARDSNNYAWAWGTNADGELGNNTTNNTISSPVSVLGNIQWRDLKIMCYIGHNIVTGLDSNGYAWQWGGQAGGSFTPIGNNTTSAYSSPVSVVGNKQWLTTAIFFSGIVGALDTNSYAWTWGIGGGYGEFGTNSNLSLISSPVSVVGGLQFTQIGFAIDAGTISNTMYGLTSTGNLWAWGANLSGTIGDGTTDHHSSPVLVLSGVKTVTGRFNIAATDGKSTVWSWGINSTGTVGDSTTIGRSSPVSINVVNSLSLTPTVVQYGVLGDNTTSNRSNPVLLAGTLHAKNKRGS